MDEQERKVLSEEDIQTLMDASSYEYDKLRLDKTALNNTLEDTEAEWKQDKELGKYIDPGVMINSQLILGANVEEEGYRGYGAFIMALSEGHMNHAAVKVTLTIKEIDRFQRLLKGLKTAAITKRRLLKLRAYQKKTNARRRY